MTLFFGVAVEPRHRAQSPGHRGSSSSSLFEGRGVAFDVSPPNREQRQMATGARCEELTQIESVCVPSRTPIAGEETGQSQSFTVSEQRVAGDHSRR
jgi:hypothetical protein